MAVFDMFKRFVNPDPAGGERRLAERVRTSLGARVLVVDDSATIRAVLGKMLLQDGYEVLKAADGESAIEMAQSQLPELIFLDIVLPGISGFAALRALRRDSRTRTTPIVMMSGNPQATEQFYVQRFGADAFLKKPFGRLEVFHAIRSLVQARRMPVRVEVPPMDAIPEGMSAEEWDAIPDVGLPDEAQVAAPARLEPVSEPPSVPEEEAAVAGHDDSQVPEPPLVAVDTSNVESIGDQGMAGRRVWSISAISGSMRPGWDRAMRAVMTSMTSGAVSPQASKSEAPGRPADAETSGHGERGPGEKSG